MITGRDARARETRVTQGRSANSNGCGRLRWGLLGSLSLYGLCAASLAGVCLYFFLGYVPGQRAAAIKRCQEELKVRAASHKASLDRWLAGGISDAEILAKDRATLRLLASSLGNYTTGRVAVSAAQLRDIVGRFIRLGSYDRVVLLDARLEIALDAGKTGPLEPSVLQTAAEVAAQGKTATNFHRHADGSVEVAFLARVGTGSVPGANDGAGPPSGVILLELDPNHWLYPYLAMRPMAATSAESVLMRRDGGDIVYLSPLRNNPAAPLTLRRPATTPGLAALAAVEGREGFGAYVDYRGEPVFALAVRLDNAPWGLVVKVDQRDALASYRLEVGHAGATAAIALLGFWAVALLLVRAWRQRAAQALEAEHSLLSAIINRPDDVIVFSLDADYRYTAFNEKHRQEMKKVWNADIRIGMNLLDCMQARELRDLAKLSIDRALRGEAFWEEQHQPGLDIYYEFSWNPVVLGKRIVGVAAFIRDITARKRDEQVLRDSEAQLRGILNATPFPIALVDVEDDRIEFWSRSALALFGHTAPTASQWYEMAYPDPDYRRELIERWKSLLGKARVSGETVNTGEYRVTCRDGSVRLCELYATFLPNRLIVTFNDVSERQRAEAALQESETRFRDTFEHAAVGQSLTGPDGKLLKVNQALADMLGYSIEDMQQTTAAQLTHPDDIAETQECIRSLFAGERATYRTEKRYWHRDGHFVFADVSTTLLRDTKGAPLCLITSIVDISARRRAEEEQEKAEERLRMAQRMEAIGGLAGGIAHDFNNVLSVILGCTELAIERAREDDGVRDELLQVKKAGERAAALTRQLLAFSRKQVLQPVVLDLNRIAAGIEKMLRRILGEDIDYVQVLAPDLGMVWADPSQIEQVLMNVVVNARDAMPSGGKLTIETRNVDLDQDYAARHVVVKPGPYVELVVTDTGCGMDAETQARIFEPFFTTKEKGKGTGLGLATVYGIVKQSGGDIWVYSEPGRGTTFKIHLPRLQSVVAPGPAVKPLVTRTAGTETILLVEDEEGVRNIARRILNMAGYTVLTAGTASDALLICKAHQGQIHLLLTDVVMPHMSGKTLAERLALERPGTKFLYMSGYTDNAIVHYGTLDPGTNFIAKPFTAADLTRKVREVLDHQP
jgi:PAS domain S-box-containing protein